MFETSMSTFSQIYYEDPSLDLDGRSCLWETQKKTLISESIQDDLHQVYLFVRKWFPLDQEQIVFGINKMDYVVNILTVHLNIQKR